MRPKRRLSQDECAVTGNFGRTLKSNAWNTVNFVAALMTRDKAMEQRGHDMHDIHDIHDIHDTSMHNIPSAVLKVLKIGEKGQRVVIV